MNDRQEIWRNIFFMNIENINAIGVVIDNHSNHDPFKTLLIFFNAEREEIEINLPEQDWTIVFCDLNTEEDDVNIPITNEKSIIIPALSTVVLADNESVKAYKK
jgi:pullulanase